LKSPGVNSGGAAWGARLPAAQCGALVELSTVASDTQSSAMCTRRCAAAHRRATSARLEATVHEGVMALLETGALQTAAVRLYERYGYRRRSAFGGYPDNGLSLFLEKQLAA
jgi:hypothetical protein